MSSAYSSRFAATNALALGLVLDRLDLVVEDGVDRGLRPHHGDRGARQGDAAVGLEGRPRHRVEPGAVGLADDHRDLRHGRFGDGADHLRAVADDPLALDRGADHEAGHVGEEEQRHVEGVAGLDEAGRLVGGVDEEDAALLLAAGWRRRRPRGRRAARSRRSALSPSACGPRGSESASSRASSTSRMSKGWFSSAGTISAIAAVGGRRGRLGGGRLLAPVARHEGEVALREVDRLLVALDQEVAAAGDAGVHLAPRPSPPASPSRRSPSPPSAASPGTSRRCPRA